MFELTINNNVYKFVFGMGFLKDLDPTITRKIDGVTGKVEKLGVQYAIAGIIDGNVEDLVTVLDYGNKYAGQSTDERLSRKDIEAYIEDENTDIDRLFEDVLDFLSKANVTKKIVANLLAAVEEQKAKQAAKNEQN